MRAVKWASILSLVALGFGCLAAPEVNLIPSSLTINSEPSGARIYEEGKFIGNSPLTIQFTVQSYGSTSITATKEGYQSQTKLFQYNTASGPNYSLLFILEPRVAPQQQQQQQQQSVVVMPGGVGAAAKTFGALTILSTPSPAEVYVDGTFVATTPVSSLQIEAGPHKIEIQKSGYKTWSRTMQVLANSPVKIEVELEKL
ncbi:MAG: PEGA domain-containing protein [Acidobacteriota bacterium]|nr:PEGA domain-containing protein [Acidobacteriota bacterium]